MTKDAKAAKSAKAIKVERAHSPKWGDATKQAIILIVKFSHIEDEVAFSAMANDSELHGRELHSEALAGKFGKIAPYDGPSEQEIKMQAFNRARACEQVKVERRIAILERASRLGIITELEQEELTAIEIYSIELERAEGPDLPRAPAIGG